MRTYKPRSEYITWTFENANRVVNDFDEGTSRFSGVYGGAFKFLRKHDLWPKAADRLHENKHAATLKKRIEDADKKMAELKQFKKDTQQELVELKARIKNREPL